MIPKSGNRFSDKSMPRQMGMIPKSGNRFSDKSMPQTNGASGGIGWFWLQ
jgi:hypothetical protein